MERDQALTKEVERYCKKIGADVVGLADPDLFNRFPEGIEVLVWNFKIGNLKNIGSLIINK